MKHAASLFSLLAATSILLSACSPEPSAGAARSSLHRESDPSVPADNLSALVGGNNAFGLDLYQSLRSQRAGQNLIFSPYSISLALAMTYAGARGDTEAQMARTLHFALPQENLHPAFDELDLKLSQEARPSSQDQQPLQLHIANAVWAERTFSFLQSYLDLIALNYGAGIQLADFVNQPEVARQQINDWVSQQTEKKIKDLIPEGALEPRTRMVLVNALYFKANWEQQFDAGNTKDAPFNRLDGSQIQVKMMSDSMSGIPYSSGDGYQAAELAYQGGTAAMDIIVPDAGRFEQLDSQLDSKRLDEILGAMQPVTVQLGLPKFTFTEEFDLGSQLDSLGMHDAFDSDLADFSGMTGKRDLFITKALHKAFVAVDEKGTEAAAATGVIMGLTSAMRADQTLIVDRPFIFVIRDLKTGQILFLGRVMDPTE